MGVTREDLVRTGHWLTVSDEEWKLQLDSVKQAVGGYIGNDVWATKIHKNVGIVLTSSNSGKAYLKGSVESHKALGYWLTLAFDNFIDPDNGQSDIDYNAFLPPKDVLVNVDTLLIPHHQTWGGVSYPFVWLLRLASGLMSQFEYVLVNNGDCIIEKPQGFPKLLELLGDADIMSSGPALPREIGTAGILMRSSAFLKIAKHMNDHMVPFEEYEKSTQEFGNTEGRLAVAVRELGLKQVKVEPGSCPSHPRTEANPGEIKGCEQFHVPGFGTWYDLIGFRHIHGEHNYAYRYHPKSVNNVPGVTGIPPEAKYFDPRYMGDEYNKIKEYWETKDIKILESWWEK